MTDGMAGTQGGENVKVLDIAELLLSRRASQHSRIIPNQTGGHGGGNAKG